MVARQREWEDGLVGVYKRFLEMCETEVSGERFADFLAPNWRADRPLAD